MFVCALVVIMIHWATDGATVRALKKWKISENLNDVEILRSLPNVDFSNLIHEGKREWRS